VSSLNSAFCYILRTPCADGDESGVIYVWKGSKCDSYFFKIAEEVFLSFKFLNFCGQHFCGQPKKF